MTLDELQRGSELLATIELIESELSVDRPMWVFGRASMHLPPAVLDAVYKVIRYNLELRLQQAKHELDKLGEKS